MNLKKIIESMNFKTSIVIKGYKARIKLDTTVKNNIVIFNIKEIIRYEEKIVPNSVIEENLLGILKSKLKNAEISKYDGEYGKFSFAINFDNYIKNQIN